MISALYEPFRKWSDGGSVWLISDTHFDDKDTRLMNPNWISVDEHIAYINSKVFKNDTLVCLGDCGNLERFKEIKCANRVLIKGNHDDKGNSRYLNCFKEVYDGPLFIMDRLLLSHEPVYGLAFCCNIHGHMHNYMHEYVDEQGGKHINIASDVVDYKVFNLGAMIKGGLLSDIPSLHRLTIDRAIANPIHK